MIGCTLWGNGYARIYRDEHFRPLRLQMLQPYDCEPILTVDDEVVYRELTNYLGLEEYAEVLSGIIG